MFITSWFSGSGNTPATAGTSSSWDLLNAASVSPAAGASGTWGLLNAANVPPAAATIEGVELL